MATQLIQVPTSQRQSRLLAGVVSAGVAVVCPVPVVRALDRPASASGSSNRAGMCLLFADATSGRPPAFRLREGIADTSPSC